MTDCPRVSNRRVRRASGIGHPNIGLFVGPGLPIDIDLHRGNRPVERIRPRLTEALLGPILPEAEGLMHHHRPLARPDELAARGEMAAQPGVIDTAALVGPGQTLGNPHPTTLPPRP